jgi:hypothetical protein
MRIGRGNQSISENPASVPFCPPQIPHDLTWDRTYKLIFTRYYWTAISESNTWVHSDIQVEIMKFILYDID